MNAYRNILFDRHFSWARVAMAFFAIVILCACAYHFVQSVLVIKDKGFIDLPIFLQNLAGYLKSGNLYPDAGDISGYEPGGTAYKFPPVYMVPFLPFFDGSSQSMALLLYGYWWANIVLYLAGCVGASIALSGCVKGNFQKWVFLWLCICVSLVFVPFFEMLFCLSFEGLLNFFIAVAIVVAGKKKNWMFGAIIGLVSMMKIYPFFLVLKSVPRNFLRFIAWFIFACVVILSFSVMIFGFKNNYLFYFSILPYLLAEKCSVVGNLSFSLCGVILQLPGMTSLRDEYSGSLFSFDTLFFLVRFSFLFSAILFLGRLGRSPRWGFIDDALSVAFATCTMILCIPNAWARYQIVLIIPVFLIILDCFRSSRSEFFSSSVSIFISITVVISIYLLVIFLDGELEPSDIGLSGVAFYVTFSVTAMTLFLIANYFLVIVDPRVFVLVAGLSASLISRDFWSDFDLWYFKLWSPPLRYQGYDLPVTLPIHLSQQFMYVRALFPVALWVLVAQAMERRRADQMLSNQGDY